MHYASYLQRTVLLISAPSLGVYYCQQLTLSVCPSVTKLQIASSFLLLDGIEPFFGRQFSMTPSTKRYSSIFDLGPLTPKILLPKICTKSPITRLVRQMDRRCLGLPRGFSGMADSMEPCKMLWGWPLLPLQRSLVSARISGRLPACKLFGLVVCRLLWYLMVAVISLGWWRAPTLLENLEKSGNWKVVSKKSGKIREKSGKINYYNYSLAMIIVHWCSDNNRWLQ